MSGWAVGSLDADQRAWVEERLPGAELIRDMSWGLVDTTVLHLRVGADNVVVKAAGAGDTHLPREIAAHPEHTAPLVATGQAAALRDSSTHAVRLVPTHGDWHPRNWLIDQGTVRVIDFGRFAFRPASTDLTRLAAQQWRSRPELEQAFFSGYGDDPRDPDAWRLEALREAVGTACWAYRVGDEAFERQGHRMLAEALAAY